MLLVCNCSVNFLSLWCNSLFLWTDWLCLLETMVVCTALSAVPLIEAYPLRGLITYRSLHWTQTPRATWNQIDNPVRGTVDIACLILLSHWFIETQSKNRVILLAEAILPPHSTHVWHLNSRDLTTNTEEPEDKNWVGVISTTNHQRRADWWTKSGKFTTDSCTHQTQGYNSRLEWKPILASICGKDWTTLWLPNCSNLLTCYHDTFAKQNTGELKTTASWDG